MKQKIKIFIFIICIVFTVMAPPKRRQIRSLSPLSTCKDLAQLDDLEEEIERLSLSPTSPQSPINGRFSTPSEQEPAQEKELSWEELRERQERRQKLRILASALMVKEDCLGDVNEITRQRKREDDVDRTTTKRSKSDE